MTSHQYLIDWFRKFNIIVSPEERESVTKNFLSGYECGQFERCPFAHMLAAMVVHMGNTELLNHFVELDIPREDPKRMTSDEWVHMDNLASKWSGFKLNQE